LFVLGVQLDTGFVVHGIFDNAQKTLVCTLADDYSLADELVTADIARRSHGTTSIAARGVQSRVQTAEVRALCLSATALCSHGDHIRAADNEYTLVLNEFAIPYKQSATVDVDDLALSAFTAVLFDIVFMSNLRTVTVRCYSVFVSAGNLRHLGVQQCSYISLLINNL
jgi:hypothetical protein